MALSIKEIDLEKIVDYSQQNEQAIVGRFFQQTHEDYTEFFVDVGAFDGVTGSNSRFLAELGWGGIVIEPAPEVFARLEELYSQNPVVACLRLAVSDYASDEVEMLISEGPEGVGAEEAWHYSQVSTLNSWFADNFVERHKYRYKPVNVRVRPLTQCLVEHGSPSDLAALFIDCEGEDFRILKAFDFSQFQPRLLSVECDDSSRPRYADFLRSHGYVEFDHTACNTFFCRKH